MEFSTKASRAASSRRAPYVAAACDYCHGRKLKCSGDRPCQRCTKTGVSCSYPTKAPNVVITPFDAAASQKLPDQEDDSQEPTSLMSSIDDLQRQLDSLRSRLNRTTPEPPVGGVLGAPDASRLKSSFSRDAILESSDLKKETSRQDFLSVFTDTMLNPDARLADPRSFSEAPTTSNSSPRLDEGLQLKDSPQPQTPGLHPRSKEASLQHLTVEELLQHLDLFERVCNVLYSVPQFEKIKASAPSLLRAAKRSLWTIPTNPGHCGYLEMLKIILAISLVFQAGSRTELSDVLYRSVEPCITTGIFQHSISYNFRILLLLVASYHLASDDLVLGTRTVTYTVRTAVEQGLYRFETLKAKFPDGKERDAMIGALWCAFVQDRQFNFTAGLPHLLNENDIDLPLPVDAPFLAAMVSFVIMGHQNWKSLVSRDLLASGQVPSQEAIHFFQYQIHLWREGLDPSVGFDAALFESNAFLTTTRDETAIYRKSLLYLRSYQIQILVIRPILLYPHAIRDNIALVTNAITMAKQSVRTLHVLATQTTLYKARQSLFNHCLSTSLALLFLAAAYETDFQTNGVTNPYPRLSLLGDAVNELQAGLDIIDQFRQISHSAARLWTRFDNPRQQLIRLGILNGPSAPEQHHAARTVLQIRNPPDADYRMAGVENEPRMAAFGELSDFEVDDNMPFDMDAAGFELDEAILSQGWAEPDSKEPNVPLGMPAWG